MQETTNLKLNKPGLTDNVNIEDLNENADIIDGVVGDYMYQLPNIVGTQIRINRLSDTNRLFFKLENDLAGNISISTDNGATEKPLQDIEGAQITQLEKGFVEVVADANFFILRNRGISGSDKQALIDIVNEAERNESDLRQLFIDDINSKGASLTEHSTWFDALNALSNIEIGKKKEIGVKTVSSSSVAFEYADGSGTINSPSISIFDLDFLPSLIFTISVTNRTVTIYSDIDDGFYEKTVKKFSFGGNALGATSTRNLKGDVLPAFVNFGEFCIPTGSVEILWIAIE